MPDRIDEVTLVASELVTNRVRPDQAPVPPALHRIHHPDSEDHMRLEVWDAGLGFNFQDIRAAWDSRCNGTREGATTRATVVCTHFFAIVRTSATCGAGPETPGSSTRLLHSQPHRLVEQCHRALQRASRHVRVGSCRTA